MVAGDKDGYLGFWSLPSTIDSSLPKLENGMSDVSVVGDSCQFRLSKLFILALAFMYRPITRLFYGEGGNDLFCCSYDKSVKRFDMNTMKFDTVFKLNNDFDDDIFIHHCIAVPGVHDSYYVSLSNGYSLCVINE